MSKTTNYEISKKLAEIGFEAETGFYWYEYDKGEEMRYIADADGAGKYKAYDLEILLDAIPKTLSVMQEIYPIGFHLNIDLNESAQTFSYIEDGLLSLQEHHEEAFVIKTQDESLADTAGLLIIWLYEKNLIKF
jgi:hypothetical protein